jgi:hypothetical protein
MERYNADMAAGEDREFHKYADWLKPLTTPTYATLDPPRQIYRILAGRAEDLGKCRGAGRGSHTSAGAVHGGGHARGNIAHDAFGYSNGPCIGRRPSSGEGREGLRLKNFEFKFKGLLSFLIL